MTVGFEVSKGIIDSQAGNIAVQLRDLLERVASFNATLGTLTEDLLEGLGYTSNDIAILKSAYGDLTKLRNIYLGLDTQATAYDFTTFAKLLVGVL